MKNSNTHKVRVGVAFTTTMMSGMLLVSCASAPQSPPGSADVRAKLSRLQADANLASHAPIEIREAETAVRLAETPVPQDEALGVYRVYLADYKVEIAEAKATTRYAEDQRVLLSEARDRAQLRARTMEAERARTQADLARSDASMARSDADMARSDAVAARTSAATAAAEADAARASAAYAAAEAARRAEQARNETDQELAEMQRQIDLLQAKTTERGLVLTLGNVLFETGRADLKSTGKDSLNNLVNFMNQYQDRNIVIEGHTDNVGSDSSNLALSTRRAESVQSYLLQQGIGSQRMSATGLGENQPIASNDTETGRQENRRVEIIIMDPAQQVSALEASRQ